MNSSIHNADAENGDPLVVKIGFKMILSDERYHRSALRQLNADGAHEWTDHRWLLAQATRWDGRTVGKDKTIKWPRVTNTSTANLRMDRSFMSVVKADLKDVSAFQL